MTALVAIVVLVGAFADDTAKVDPAGAAYRTELHQQLDAQIAALTKEIETSPEKVDLYSRRGDARFFRGQFKEAVADFNKMLELQPDLESQHWRRGIACFYAGKFEDAAKQFEIYHTFDDVDRENGIWRYLSQVRAVGRKKAREGLLKYKKDDREPFPDVYKHFAGELTGAEILEKIQKADLSDTERRKRLFYAELYVGLNAAVEDQPEAAEKHLLEAVRNEWGRNAGGGPGWMWHVGRVHLDVLRAKDKSSK
jgi:lipoprotein NlpI